MSEACCTCATLLADVQPLYDEKTEKPLGADRRLDCCSRVICGPCIYKNSRFATYCPFCQLSTSPSPISNNLWSPPRYTPPSSTSTLPPSYSPPTPPSLHRLPSYNSLHPTPLTPPPEKSSSSNLPAEDVLHFIDHSIDSVASLSLRYGVPVAALRRTNNLTSDHLLLARRTLLIPGEFYKGGVSLSPRPVEGEEEEVRKGKVRRFMVGSKVSDYDVALLYLEQVDYDLDAALEAFREDDRWEKEHPLQGVGKGKGKMKHDAGKRRFTGQRS